MLVVLRPDIADSETAGVRVLEQWNQAPIVEERHVETFARHDPDDPDRRHDHHDERQPAARRPHVTEERRRESRHERGFTSIVRAPRSFTSRLSPRVAYASIAW